jgi:hypothetical protein
MAELPAHPLPEEGQQQPPVEQPEQPTTEGDSQPQA